MTTNYKRGYAFELKVWKDLERNGMFVVRSGGSRGMVDMAAHAPGPINYYVQCKRDGRLSIEDRRDLYNLAMAFNATPILAYRDDDGQIKYSEIAQQGDAYVDWHPNDEPTIAPACDESVTA
jgi:Holliday junction resolvase